MIMGDIIITTTDLFKWTKLYSIKYTKSGDFGLLLIYFGNSLDPDLAPRL